MGKERVKRAYDQKWEIVLECLRSRNVAETCRQFQISAPLYYRWKAEIQKKATASPDTSKDRRIRQLEHSLWRKTQEAELLRNSTGYRCGQLHLQARGLVKQGYEPTLVADALSISRSSLYYRKQVRARLKKSEAPKYKEVLLSTLHCPPAQYGINRTTWTTKLLSGVMTARGYTAGHNTVSQIIKAAGYKFRKAREVLTSNDPNYRSKLRKITAILSRLGPQERFFSIDEFGPFSVKKKGGRRLVASNEYPTVPQWQRSKGFLIVTAALELSTNQITHFYSEKKNSREMIKLLNILAAKCSGCKRIYLSWDAASWHASKLFRQEVRRINEQPDRGPHAAPNIRLAPLPARAQFLNVIESVFSGLAKAVIHNSDYGSIEEAKMAIDRYFTERNEHFRQNPKRAGKKIWGKELVPAKFSDGQNCKQVGWR